MNFPVFINKWIISNKYLRYRPIWYWYRLINHDDYRLDDRFRYQDFWNSINEGQTQMVEDDKWMTYFGAKPDTIYISKEAYDEIQKRLSEPPDPKSIEKLKQLLERRALWDE